jgi:hypothetical protein
MMARARLLLWIPILLTIAASGATAQNPRVTVFISDTHFGVGKTPDGKWHPYEDARWAPEFKLFIEELNREGNGQIDLILNGDTFELWQSLQNDCIYPDENLSCTEGQALARLRTVIAAHQAELDSIRSFAVAGDNRVFIIRGNHDAAIRFPALTAAVLAAIGAPADRVKIPADGYWLSDDGLIYAEHGHQIGKDPNQFSNWPSPFVKINNVTYMQRPWGEQFVQKFYNSFEMKYPIIDNIQGELSGVKYGYKVEGTIGVGIALGKFVVSTLLQSSWTQNGQVLGAQDGAAWDTVAIRKGGDRFFAESIPKDDPLRKLVEKSVKDRSFGSKLSDLSDKEIQSICDVRAAIVADDTRNHKPPRVELCPKPSLGAVVGTVTSSRDAIFQQHLLDTFTQLRALGSTRPFTLFVFSHTHFAESSYSPFAGSSSNWRPIVVNTGAWQRTISEDQLETLRRNKGLKEKDVLKLQPEDLIACYPVIMVAPYSTTPQSVLRYWKQTTGNWGFADSCN